MRVTLNLVPQFLRRSKKTMTFITRTVLLMMIACIGFCAASVSGQLLEFTYVPAYGSSDNLTGRVHAVDPSRHVVATYIYLEELGWWTKPDLPCSGVPIESDSSWEVDITTSVEDIYATAICAFLIPNDVECPTIAGEQDLPDSLFDMCVDAACTTRVMRTVLYSGYEWDVRRSCWRSEPGPNYFSNGVDNVWVDGQDRLHLTVRRGDRLWYCSEVILKEALGYGTYVFQLDSKVGDFDQNVVLGLFVYDSGAWEVFNREMDIEFAKWGNVTYPNAQFVIQPYEVEGNIYQWMLSPAQKASTHSFCWTSDSVRFESARGHQSSPPFDSILDTWTYTNAGGIPEPGDERVTLNLWLFESLPPTNGMEPEVVITNFAYYPLTAVQEFDASSAGEFRLMQNRPNPFAGSTVIGYSIGRPERVILRVSDASGRIVRTLLNEEKPAGYHYVCWDGRDDAGTTLNSGVYFCSFQAGRATGSSKMIFIR
jgi:hypothetical protein